VSTIEREPEVGKRILIIGDYTRMDGAPITSASNLPDGLVLYKPAGISADLEVLKKHCKTICDKTHAVGAYEALQFIELTPELGFQWYYPLTDTKIKFGDNPAHLKQKKWTAVYHKDNAKLFVRK